MPPRPFPYRLSIGIDICHIPRIYQLITSEQETRWATRPVTLFRFMNRLLTEHEQKLFWQRHGRFTLAKEKWFLRTAEYLAGRWAAKEAVIKAARPRRLTFGEILILSNQGKPFAVILDQLPPKFESPRQPGWIIPGASGPIRGIETGRWEPDTEAQAFTKQLSEKALKASTYDVLNEAEGQIAEISISHDGEYATAICMAPSDDGYIQSTDAELDGVRAEAKDMSSTLDGAWEER